MLKWAKPDRCHSSIVNSLRAYKFSAGKKYRHPVGAASAANVHVFNRISTDVLIAAEADPYQLVSLFLVTFTTTPNFLECLCQIYPFIIAVIILQLQVNNDVR